MSKEIARFQLTSGANNLERWVIPDNVNVITENTDSTHYSETYQHKFYNSAIINFDTSLYGYLWASSMLLFDASCQITVERSTDGGSTWSNYRTTNFQTLRGSFYTSSGGDSGIGGTYWINMNSNDSQCISSVLPIYDNATDFNNAVTNVYVPEKTSGGAGSGYIGNSLLSNKKMVGYNVPTSSAESTKTESSNEYSASPVSGKPKAGNGHAKIKQITTIKSNALFVGANTEVASLHKDSSNRKYLKLYDDYSICVMYYDPNYQYYGPLFLSTLENGVKYKTAGDWTYESTDFSTTIINGVSWKLAWSRYWLPYPDNDEDWDLPVISGVLPNNADYWNYQYDAQEVTTLINAILNAVKE